MMGQRRAALQHSLWKCVSTDEHHEFGEGEPKLGGGAGHLRLHPDLDVPIRFILLDATKERAGGAGSEPPPDEKMLGTECTHDGAEPAPEVPDLRRAATEQSSPSACVSDRKPPSL